MSSTVYLCEEHETENRVAIKVFKDAYLTSKDNVQITEDSEFEKEVRILKKVQTRGVVCHYDSGNSGTMVHADGSQTSGLNYIVMEYIQQDFFDFCVTMGAQGEEAGRLFLNQMIDVVNHIH